MGSHEIYRLSERLGELLAERHATLTLAESCTGGGVAYAITAISGSSAWFDRGFVTYSNAAKVAELGVSELTLARHGAVSREVALEMARGALQQSQADYAIAITGVAGPTGGSANKPVGTVWFGFAKRDGKSEALLVHFNGDRVAIREQAIQQALTALFALIDKNGLDTV